MSRPRLALVAAVGFTVMVIAVSPSHGQNAGRAPGWQVHPTENPNAVVCDLPPEVIEEQFGVPFETMLERQAAAMHPARSDTIKALVLLCQWEDHMADTTAHPPEAYDDLFFSQDVIDPGSLHEFFLEVSYGSFVVQGQVYGWFTQPTYIWSLYFSDFFAAADPFIDYSEFDHDNDGYTDAVYVIHAGPGQEETHNPGDIWSFAFMYGYDYMTEDGVIIDAFACNPEQHADGSITTIRVACHEASHVAGLPDLYDYDRKLDVETYYTPDDENDHPLVDWCVMGYAGYNIMSYGTRQDPSHHCAWSKMQLGFMTPTILSESQHDVAAPEVELNPAAFKIPHPDPASQEYFLVENRNTMSAAKFDHLDSDFSAYFDWFTFGQNQKDPGLMIYHIDDQFYNNEGTPEFDHYMVIVEDAGYDPDNPWDGYSEFSEWWYPYEFRIGAAFAAEDTGQTMFTPETAPNSDWYDGPSGIWITNISMSGPIMTFDLGFGNAWPAITAYSPAALDTTVPPAQMVVFEITAIDENDPALTYEWYLDGLLMQSGASPSYTFIGELGSPDYSLIAVATDGELADSLTWTIDIEGVGTTDSPVPSQLSIAASPTPFISSVVLNCHVPSAGHTLLTIHDAGGRMVTTLIDEHRDLGPAPATWHGTDSTGEPVSPGVYFARLAVGSVSVNNKIVLIR